MKYMTDAQFIRTLNSKKVEDYRDRDPMSPFGLLASQELIRRARRQKLRAMHKAAKAKAQEEAARKAQEKAA